MKSTTWLTSVILFVLQRFRCYAASSQQRSYDIFVDKYITKIIKQHSATSLSVKIIIRLVRKKSRRNPQTY